MTTTGEINSLATRVATEFKAIRTLISGSGTGNVSALDTTATDLVGAVNELVAAVGGAGATIDDENISALTVWSSDKTNDEILAAVTALVGGAPGALDTLNELAAAINDDASYAATITSALATKFTTVDASDTVKGIVELATSAETITGSDTGRAVTPAGLHAKVASATAIGLVELATDGETTTGTDTTRATTPANVAAAISARTASETAAGIVELATTAEATTGTDATRAVTPAGLKAVADTKVPIGTDPNADRIYFWDDSAGAPAFLTPSGLTITGTSIAVDAASESAAGKVELATDAETGTGTDTARAVTPANLRSVLGDQTTNFVTTFEAGLL